MIRACSNKIGAISTESTVPHPPLMSRKTRFEGESTGLALHRKVFVAFDVVGSVGVDGPDSSIVVG